MYDKYLIEGAILKNVEEGGTVTGFQYGARLPYYRGVVLSLVGEMQLSVDGERIPAEQMTVTLQGKTYKLTELEDNPVDKWEFGDVGVITVKKPGGLKPGAHKFSVRQHMKISYVPGGFWGQDEKVLTIPG